jgi:uncharacterized coiled-coil protein SlyX
MTLEERVASLEKRVAQVEATVMRFVPLGPQQQDTERESHDLKTALQQIAERLRAEQPPFAATL